MISRFATFSFPAIFHVTSRDGTARRSNKIERNRQERERERGMMETRANVERNETETKQKLWKGKGKKGMRNIAVLNARRRTDRRDEEKKEGGDGGSCADFVGVLDKFSAIGSFDADSPSAPPPTCVQIEGFRESCDILPRRRRGKDRENARNEEQADWRAERETEIPKRRERRKEEWERKREGVRGKGRDGVICERLSARVAERRDCCEETSTNSRCLPRLAPNQAVSSLNVDEPTCLLTS